MRVKAFTLVELVVTIVIAGILASVATVGFFSVRNGVSDSNARSLLTSVAGPQNSVYASRGVFVTDVDSLDQVYDNPADFVPADVPAGVDEVSVASGIASAGEPGSDAVFVAATTSGSGACFVMANFAPGSGEEIRVEQLETSATVECTANAAVEFFDDVQDPGDSGSGGDSSPALNPADLRAVAGLQEVTVYWEPQVGASYELARTTLGSQDPAVVLPVTGSGTYLDTGLVAGTTYLYTLTTRVGELTELTGPVSATPYGDDSQVIVDPDAGDDALPDAPRNFSAVGQDQQVSLSWRTPAVTGGSLQGYELDYRPANASSWVALPPQAATSSAATVGSLTNGQQYVFRIRTLSTNGVSPYSEVAATPLAAPSPPVNLSGTATQFSVDLSWDPPASSPEAVTGYRVAYKESSSSSWLDAASVNASTLTARVSSLTSNLSYDFRVRALSASGDSAWTAPITVQTRPDVPGPVPNFRVVGNERGPRVNLAWDAEPKSLFYEIQVRAVGESDWNTATSTEESLAYTVFRFTRPNGFEGDLQYDRDYEFRIRGGNNEGYGDWSLAEVIRGDTYFITAPLNVTAQLEGSCTSPGVCSFRAVLSWTPPSNGNPATQAQAQYKLPSQTWDQALGSADYELPAGAGGVFLSGLDAGTTYDVRLRLNNSLDNWSPWAQTQTSTDPLPGKPVLTVTRQQGTLDVHNLSWTVGPGAPAASYKLIATATSSPESSVKGTVSYSVPTSSATWTATVDAYAQPQQTEYLHIAAIDADGRVGPWSDPVLLENGLPPSVPPTLVALCTPGTSCPDLPRNPGQPGANQFGMEVRVPPKGENLGSKESNLVVELSSDGGSTWQTWATAKPQVGFNTLIDYLWVVGDPQSFDTSVTTQPNIAYYASSPLSSGTYLARLSSSNFRGSSPKGEPFTVVIP